MEIVISKSEVYIKEDRISESRELTNFLIHHIFLECLNEEMEILIKCEN